MTEPSARPAGYFYLGLALVTAATLALEIIQTRLLSVVTWYHLAFFVISMAMFGMTLGALRVFLQPDRFGPDALGRTLPRTALWTALAVGLCYLDQSVLAPEVAMSASTLVVFTRLALTLAIPFYFSGICVTLALTRAAYPIGVVYGADLAGAALGCLAVLPLLSLLDGPGAIFAVAGVMALGGWSFARWGREQRLGRWALAAAGLMAALAVANGATYFGFDPIIVKGVAEKRHWVSYEKWNSFSRVVAYRDREEPARNVLWAASPNTPERRVTFKEMNIDGLAGTRMFRWSDEPGALDFLLYDATSPAYALRRGKVAVIGVGGGKDLHTALAAGNEAVLGIELNPVFVDLLTGRYRRFAGLADRPGVRLVADEARSYLTRSDERFDILQASLIDTWAATGAGAFSLSENAIYTVEAWRIFLDRLTDDGVFTVSRWYAPGHIDETARLVSLATATLLAAGATAPRAHLLIGAYDQVATLLVAKRPFSPEDVQRFADHLASLGFTLVLAPGHEATAPILAKLADCTTRRELDRLAASYALDLSPPTDSRPFFFNLLRLSRPWEIAAYLGRPAGVVAGNLIATLTLLAILLITVTFAAATILIPRRFAPAGGQRPRAGALAYFALIGLGFMLTEIGIMQRLSVFLGHPVYSLAVVLFALIFFTGLGSFASERLPLTTPARLAVYSLSLAAYLALIAFLLPHINTWFQGYSLAGRIAVSLVLLAPAGLGMGQAFRAGMRLAKGGAGDPTPWLWGVNGAAGVMAGVVAIVVSIAWGITLTLLLGALCYLILPLSATGLFSSSKA